LLGRINGQLPFNRHRLGLRCSGLLDGELVVLDRQRHVLPPDYLFGNRFAVFLGGSENPRALNFLQRFRDFVFRLRLGFGVVRAFLGDWLPLAVGLLRGPQSRRRLVRLCPVDQPRRTGQSGDDEQRDGDLLDAVA
jgi:hypothetical protein